MRKFRFPADDNPDLPVTRSGSTRRGTNDVGLDDELFVPIDERIGGENREAPKRRTNFGHKTGKSNGLVDETDPSLDADGRHWPKFLSAPRNRVSELEGRLTEQSAEITLRCTQIADLSNIRQQQDSELLNACDEIERLSEFIVVLQDTTTQHMTEAAATRQRLIYSDNEKLTLRVQLDKALKEYAELLQRLLTVETAFNNRELAITAAQEEVEQLQAMVKRRLADAIEDTNQRYRNELNQQRAHFEDQIKKIEAVVEKRDMQIKSLDKSRAVLAKRYDDLAKTVDALENTYKHTQEKFESQDGQVEFLETILRVERETAERQIKELTDELQRERLEHSVAERASAAMRKNIVHLLPDLAARRNRSNAPERDTVKSHNDNAA
jgi:chromosome segregation ATPase